MKQSVFFFSFFLFFFKAQIEDKQAVPYGFQGLHLFFCVPLSGAERGESSGENGEP